MLGTGIFMKATGASWKAAAVGSVTAGSAVGTGLGIALGFSTSLFAGTTAAAAGASGLAIVGAMAAPLVLGLGLAALAGFAMRASGANDLQDAVKTAVINKRAGGMGLILGRKAFQRPLREGVELLHALQDVYLCDAVTVA